MSKKQLQDQFKEAWSILHLGNERFMKEIPQIYPINQERRTPIATVLTCCDSRVSPEILFDQTLNSLFVCRTAGNTIDESVLASLEYGCDTLKAPLLIIMGHQECGAVNAAFDIEKNGSTANLKALLQKISPAIQAVEKDKKPHAIMLEEAVIANIHHVHQEILKHSPLINKLAQSGNLKILKAKYFIDSGKVEWLNLDFSQKPSDR